MNLARSRVRDQLCVCLFVCVCVRVCVCVTLRCDVYAACRITFALLCIVVI